ncbi:hypothetical protein Q2T40_10030 [Winogradskyella maritima]|uniref:T9SS C-terminal target domain-containing protein n=1 Tax=Winogradskyella maritima TaxID=1517766 RepID=A0ABV8AJJ4_9FLAO|nr:hypothetical protein [Winogradskyella maritima]
MKKITQIAMTICFALNLSFAQQEKGITGETNWLDNWTSFKKEKADYGEPTHILTGTITEDTHLEKKHVYMLVGNVFVADSSALTIDAGTVIIGDFNSRASLVITKGSKIIAEGTDTDPIIFTSNRSRKREGDWGGIVILGDGPTNRFGNSSVANLFPNLSAAFYEHLNFGGDNSDDNSGVLKYVRIEYAGKRIGTGTYFNGLTLAGVGNATTISNIMVSYSGGNSFEFWGGDLRLDQLVSFNASSIDFEFNYGTLSSINNSLAVRSPYASGNNGSRCMQVLSFDDKEEVDFSKPATNVTAQNITLINRTDDLNGAIEKGLVKEALYVGENASLDMNKSVISGFNPAVKFAEGVKINQENLERIKFSEMYFNNCNGNIYVDNNPNNEDLENWYGNSAFFNVYSKGFDAETFIGVFDAKKPDFRLRINKIIATNDVGDND